MTYNVFSRTLNTVQSTNLYGCRTQWHTFLQVHHWDLMAVDPLLTPVVLDAPLGLPLSEA